MHNFLRYTMILLFILSIFSSNLILSNQAAAFEAIAFTVGEKKADFRVEPLAESTIEMMTTPLVKGVRLAADGWIVDPLRGISTQVQQMAEKTPLASRVPMILQDIARTAGGTRWLLYCTGKTSSLVRLTTKENLKQITADQLIPLEKKIFVRIAAATDTQVWLLDAMSTELLRVELSKPGSTPALLSKKIDPWGAALNPLSGQIVTLQANGGAVNLVIKHDQELIPQTSRSFNCGETGELTLEACLEDGNLLLSATGPGVDGIKRRFLRLDSLGAVHNLGTVRPHPFLRQFITDVNGAGTLDFQPEREGWDVITGKLSVHPLTVIPTTTRAGKIRVSHDAVPATIQPALNPATGQLAWLDGQSIFMGEEKHPLQLPETRRVLSPGDNGAELIFTGHGEPVLFERRTLRLQYITFRNKQAVIARTIILQNPRPDSAEVTLTHPWIDGSGEIYLTDTGNFSLLHWNRDGQWIGSHHDLAVVYPGNPGEFFTISEGDEPGHKVLLHYDGDGNYLRLLAELRPADRRLRISGTTVLGRDKQNQVWWAWFDGKWRAEAVDYKTGKSVSRCDLNIPQGGQFYPDTFRVSPEGTIFVARLTKDGTLELLELN